MKSRPHQPDGVNQPRNHAAPSDDNAAPMNPAAASPSLSQRPSANSRKPRLRLASAGDASPPFAMPVTPAHAPSEINESESDVLATIGEVSRRIDDLARQLHCLGHFNNHDRDRPRAA